MQKIHRTERIMRNLPDLLADANKLTYRQLCVRYKSMARATIRRLLAEEGIIPKTNVKDPQIHYPLNRKEK